MTTAADTENLVLDFNIGKQFNLSFIMEAKVICTQWSYMRSPIQVLQQLCYTIHAILCEATPA